MTREDVISNALANYGKYGIERETAEKLVDSGLAEGLSYQAIYTGIKLAYAQEYGEHTLFSTAEVAEVLGVSEEMVIQEIEKIPGYRIPRDLQVIHYPANTSVK